MWLFLLKFRSECRLAGTFWQVKQTRRFSHIHHWHLSHLLHQWYVFQTILFTSHNYGVPLFFRFHVPLNPFVRHRQDSLQEFPSHHYSFSSLWLSAIFYFQTFLMSSFLVACRLSTSGLYRRPRVIWLTLYLNIWREQESSHLETRIVMVHIFLCSTLFDRRLLVLFYWLWSSLIKRFPGLTEALVFVWNTRTMLFTYYLSSNIHYTRVFASLFGHLFDGYWLRRTVISFVVK